MESMSKKEKLARGSAVIKVMKVTPRAGRYLKSFIDVRKLPRAVSTAPAKGLLAEMPWLDVKRAEYQFQPKSAKVNPPFLGVLASSSNKDPCAIETEEEDVTKIGLPDGHRMLNWYDYREWSKSVSPLRDGNIAEHFNVMLGLLISMAVDPENANFADVEAYPAVQFLKTIKTPNGQIPYNTAAFISYIEFVCQKLIDEG